MSEICGWFDHTVVHSQLENILSIMLDHQESQNRILSACNNLAALGATSKSTAVSLESNNNIHAILLGNSRKSTNNSSQSLNRLLNAGTLIETYLVHGQSTPKHIFGSFAFAILDIKKSQCLLAIDRMGIESLCYSTNTNNGIIFGSTVQNVCHFPSIKCGVNMQSIFDYIYFHVIPSPNTIYNNIFKLEPAQYLWYDNGEVSIVRYWYPEFIEDHDNFDLKKDELKTKLNLAVDRCHPDSKTGTFLSGGLDSSTITGILAGKRENTTHAFTIGFDEQGYDEIPYARIAAKYFGAKLTEYYVTPEDVAEAIPLIAKSFDEPFGNSSAIPVFFCSRMAKENGIDTLLAGDGGDELFAGNERYAKQKIFDKYTYIPSWIRMGVIEPLLISLPFSQWTPLLRKFRSYIEQARIPMPKRTETYNFLNRIGLDFIFNRDFLSAIDSEFPVKLLNKTYSQTSSGVLMNRMLYLDWKFTLADNDLRKVNRMCQVAGINVRYPMLDDDLVSFSATVPSILKLKGSKLRYFYKQALLDFLPEEIINKPKHGFGLPFGQWLKNSKILQDIVYDNLSALKTRKIIKRKFIDTLTDTHRDGHAAYYGNMLWILAILEEWFRQHDIK